VDYDAIDASPANKQQALAYRRSVRSAPWNDCCHTSVAEDLHKLKSQFVRAGALPANADLKTYDTGNLFVITQGVTTASAVCGELYVEYSLKLMTPIFEPGLSLAGGSLVGANTQTAANPLGTAPVVKANSIGISVSNASVLTIAAPGTYMYFLALTGTVITGITATLTGAVNVGAYQTIASGALTANYSQVITVTTANATIAFSATATTISAATLDISSMPVGSGQ